MGGIRGYLVSVVSVCMLCVPAGVLVKKESMQKIVRLLSGVLVLLVVLRPLLHIDMEDVSKKLEEVCREYSFDTGQLKTDTQNQMAAYIKEATQTYIEEKAAALGALVKAEVTLSEEEYPVPVGARLTGTVTPEQLGELRKILETELNIPKEQQEWNLYGAGE